MCSSDLSTSSSEPEGYQSTCGIGTFMGHLTKRQHHVPAFYISLWSAQGKDQVICHDLHEKKHFPASPDGILARRYFYECESVLTDRKAELCVGKLAKVCPDEVGFGPGWEVVKTHGKTFLMHTGLDEGVFTLGYFDPGSRDRERRVHGTHDDDLSGCTKGPAELLYPDLPIGSATIRAQIAVCRQN